MRVPSHNTLLLVITSGIGYQLKNFGCQAIQGKRDALKSRRVSLVVHLWVINNYLSTNERRPTTLRDFICGTTLVWEMATVRSIRNTKLTIKMLTLRRHERQNASAFA